MKQSELDTILQDFEDNMFDIAELGNTTQFIHEKKLVYEQAQQALNLYIEERERLARIDEHNKLDKFLDNQIAVGAVRAWSMERKQTIKSELEG